MSKTKFIYSFGKLSLLALFTFISGCDKQQPVIEKQTTVNDEIRKPDEEKTKPAKFKDLDCVIPETYPAELLAYTVDDIEAIALSKSGKKNFIVKGNSGKTLGEIIDNVLKKYPNFDNFDAKQYKKFFPKLSEEEIQQNPETILQFMEKIMAFEVASSFSQLDNAEYALSDYLKSKSKKNARINWPSAEGFFNGVCTVTVVVAHLRLDMGGLYGAYCNALDDSNAYGGTDLNNNTMSTVDSGYLDSIRHGIWAVYMGKWGTWRYGDKSYACNILNQLVSSHECGSSGLGKKMDQHNNDVSLRYYLDQVEEYGTWWNRNTRINQDRISIVNAMKSLPNHLVSTEAEINQKNNYTLVRLN